MRDKLSRRRIPLLGGARHLVGAGKTLAAIAAIALLGVASNQCITRGFIYSNIGSLFSWSGSAQTSWNGSAQEATYSDFTTFIKNNASCGGPGSTALIDYSHATGCAVNTSAHTPILANNSFAGDVFTSWSDTTTVYGGSCATSTAYNSSATSPQDADGGDAVGSSGATSTCATGLNVTLGIQQTFTIAGTPTSQSWSFYYKWASVDSTGTCDISGNSANAVLKLNGTTVSTTAAPTDDNAWHQVSGTTTLLVNGSNTLSLTVQLQTGVHYTNQTSCLGLTYQAQPFYFDHLTLTATY